MPKNRKYFKGVEDILEELRKPQTYIPDNRLPSVEVPPDERDKNPGPQEAEEKSEEAAGRRSYREERLTSLRCCSKAERIACVCTLAVRCGAHGDVHVGTH